MKTIVRLFSTIGLIFLVCCVACDDERPEACTLTVTTLPASNITDNSAYLSGEVHGTPAGNPLKILLSDNYNNVSTGYGYVDILSPGTYYVASNTTYYYRAFVSDFFGDCVYGEILSFTTKAKVPTLQIGYIRHTNKEYLSSGFYFNGNYWKYRFTWEITLSVSQVDEVTEWGLQVGSTRFSFNSLYPLTQTRQMTYYTNGRGDKQICYAYALYNGTYLLSDPETVYFNY